MPSDERREVAARLRKTRGIMAFVEALGIDLNGDWYWTDVSRRVADLIDPATCRNVSGYQDIFECSKCRCRVELTAEVCNEHGDPFSTPFMPSFCPECGARAVDDGGSR